MLVLVLQLSLCSLCVAVTCAYVVQDQGHHWQNEHSQPQHQQNYHYEVPYQYSNNQFSAPQTQYTGSNTVPKLERPYSNQAEDKFSEVRKLRLKGNRNRFKQQFKKGRRRCKHPGRPRHHRRPHRGRKPFYPDDLRGYRRVLSPDPNENVAYARRNYNKYPRKRVEKFGRPIPKIQDRSDTDDFAEKSWSLDTNFNNKDERLVGNNPSFSNYRVSTKETSPATSYNLSPYSKPQKPLLIQKLKTSNDVSNTDRIVLHTGKHMSKLIPNHFNIPHYRTTKKTDRNRNTHVTDDSVLEHNIISPFIQQRPTEKYFQRFEKVPKRFQGLQRRVFDEEHDPCPEDNIISDTTTAKYTLIQIAKGTVNVLDHTTDSTTQGSVQGTRVEKSTHKNYRVTNQSSMNKNDFYPIVGYTTRATTPLIYKNGMKTQHQDVTFDTEDENVVTVTPAAAFPINNVYTPESDSVLYNQAKLTNLNSTRTVKSLDFHQHKTLQPRKFGGGHYKTKNTQFTQNSNNEWTPLVMKEDFNIKHENVAIKPTTRGRISSQTTDSAVSPDMMKITQEDAKVLPEHLVPKKHMKREDKTVYSQHFLPAVQRRSWINTKSDDLTAVVSTHIVVQ